MPAPRPVHEDTHMVTPENTAQQTSCHWYWSPPPGCHIPTSPTRRPWWFPPRLSAAKIGLGGWLSEGHPGPRVAGRDGCHRGVWRARTWLPLKALSTRPTAGGRRAIPCWVTGRGDWGSASHVGTHRLCGSHEGGLSGTGGLCPIEDEKRVRTLETGSWVTRRRDKEREREGEGGGREREREREEGGGEKHRETSRQIDRQADRQRQKDSHINTACNDKVRFQNYLFLSPFP